MSVPAPAPLAEGVDFDVIVIGGGVAGSVAAHQLATAGREVLLIERGAEPGSKGLSGGVFYCQVMDRIFPGFSTSEAVERRIVRNTLSFLNPTSAVNVDYRDERLADPVNAVTVLRGKLDAWLAERCEEAGVTVMPGVKVDGLVREGERVVGVRAGEDELRAHIVIAADGVNSFISKDAGLRTQEPLNHLAVGVKSVIRLGRERIEERFNLTGDEGAAFAVVGDCTRGVGGGGFLYTNTDTVSIGVVLRLDDLKAKGFGAAQVHDHFVDHPAIRPYVRDGELLEYGSHLVAEGGKAMVKNLTRPGFMVIGDAAGLTLNTGFTVRGMDLAAGSAVCAAEAADKALAGADVGAQAMAAYEQALWDDVVGKDMTTYQHAPHFLENPRMYSEYGQLLADVLHGVYNLDGTPRRHLLGTARAALKNSPVRLRELAKDAYQAVRSL